MLRGIRTARWYIAAHRSGLITLIGESIRMNWDQVEGKWKQLRGSAKQQWGKLTDDDLEQIAGMRDQLVGRLQERYGIAREEAQKKADEWIKVQNDGAGQRSPQEHHSAKG
jgi:uncharacterized protein YjbJ (UPF0337 family)